MIGDRILEVLGDGDLRGKLIAKGFVRHRIFTWKKTAEKTLDIIRNMEL